MIKMSLWNCWNFLFVCFYIFIYSFITWHLPRTTETVYFSFVFVYKLNQCLCIKTVPSAPFRFLCSSSYVCSKEVRLNFKAFFFLNIDTLEFPWWLRIIKKKPKKKRKKYSLKSAGHFQNKKCTLFVMFPQFKCIEE